MRYLLGKKTGIVSTTAGSMLGKLERKEKKHTGFQPTFFTDK